MNDTRHQESSSTLVTAKEALLPADERQTSPTNEARGLLSMRRDSTSNTWSSSECISDQDETENRGPFVLEYNRLAKKV